MNKHTFEALEAIMPKHLIWFDPFQHKTVEDLVYAAQHELDLYNEGEETNIKGKADLNAVKDFLSIATRAQQKTTGSHIYVVEQYSNKEQ